MDLASLDRDLIELTRRQRRAEERFDYEEAFLLNAEIDKLLDARLLLLTEPDLDAV